MQYVTDPKKPDEWWDLERIRKEVGSGHWHSSKIFEEVGVAIESNMPLSQFWSYEDTDRAYMIAYHRVTGTMQAFERHLAAKESKRNRPKNAQQERRP